MQKDRKTLYNEGIEYAEKGDYANAVKSLKGACDLGSQNAFNMLLALYGDVSSPISAEEFVKEIKHYSSVGNFFAKLHLGMIATGVVSNPYSRKFNERDFTNVFDSKSKTGSDIMSEAISEAEKKSIESGEEAYEILGLNYFEAAYAFRHSAKNHDVGGASPNLDKCLSYLEKAIECSDKGLAWARKYMPPNHPIIDNQISLKESYVQRLNSRKGLRK